MTNDTHNDKRYTEQHNDKQYTEQHSNKLPDDDTLVLNHVGVGS